MKLFSRGAFPAFFVILCVGAMAQLGIAQSQTDYAWQSVRLKHISPKFAAYFLDPENHPMPAEMQAAQVLIPKSQHSENLHKVDSHEDSAGMEKVLFAPDNRSMRIWVYATPQQFEQIEQKIASWDKPMRSIKFETQIIQLQTSDESALSKLALDKENLTYLPATPEINALLDNLVEQGKAKITNEQSTSALDNLHARIGKSTIQNATVKIVPNGNDAEVIETPAQLERQSALLFTPSINIDDRVVVFVNITDMQILKNGTNDSGFLIKNGLSSQSSVFTTKSGETVIISGVNLPATDNPDHHFPTVLRVKTTIIN